MITKREAPAKINLGLHVVRKRDDGYHDLETVFLRIGWADLLTVRPAETLTLTCSDASLPTDDGNLVLQAARLLADTYDVTEGATLHLDKHLPHGAGLGGGSSDAATALRTLRDLWALDASDADLHPLAARLGSDVPFFLGPKAAYATGRGVQLTSLVDPATDDLYELPFALVVAVPPAAVSTAEAYRRVTPRATGRPDLRAVVLSNDLERWRADLTNDFEASVFDQYPAIRHTKQALVNAGAGYASMSGSGSAVFGVFTDEAQAHAATEALRTSGHRVWHGVTG